MKISITALKMMKGEDCNYDEEIDIDVKEGDGFFKKDFPPMEILEMDIEGTIYKFLASDLKKVINALF